MWLFSKQFALVWFFLIFVGVLLWVFWPSHRSRFEKAGESVLHDDDPPGTETKPTRE
ncbi:MAG: cbb3-type cytochrome c oxidase subunit 3 [Magnetococcales bacterium]|nr:cbb3-type cytochrome c oxidase subunit 3 [Magnetococcales bacterium]